MSTDEQDQLMGQMLRELQEKEKESRCLRYRLGQWEKQFRDATSLIHRGPQQSDDALLSLPSPETVHQTVTHYRAVLERVAALRADLKLD